MTELYFYALLSVLLIGGLIFSLVLKYLTGKTFSNWHIAAAGILWPVVLTLLLLAGLSLWFDGLYAKLTSRRKS